MQLNSDLFLKQASCVGIDNTANIIIIRQMLEKLSFIPLSKTKFSYIPIHVFFNCDVIIHQNPHILLYSPEF